MSTAFVSIPEGNLGCNAERNEITINVPATAPLTEGDAILQAVFGGGGL